LPPEYRGRPYRLGGGCALFRAAALNINWPFASTLESEEDELELLELRSRGEADAISKGAFAVPSTVVDCCACTSEADPATRKLRAAARQRVPKRLPLVFIV
jgi:hypothetical protein